MLAQTKLALPKDQKNIRLTVKLNQTDLDALQRGMNRVGETNASGYVRRLIHKHKGGDKS